MFITIELLSCMDCRHKDHSGAFTPGGAKPVCDHDDAPCGPTSIKAEDRYHWKYRVINKYPEIPSWCPLKNGSKY